MSDMPKGYHRQMAVRVLRAVAPGAVFMLLVQHLVHVPSWSAPVASVLGLTVGA